MPLRIEKKSKLLEPTSSSSSKGKREAVSLVAHLLFIDQMTPNLLPTNERRISSSPGNNAFIMANFHLGEMKMGLPGAAAVHID